MGHVYQWIARAGCQRSDTNLAGSESAPELIYLAHCVPNPPDKGEKIRAFHELQFLVAHYRVHLVCFARNEQDMARAKELRECASIYVERLSKRTALARAAVQFAAGGCLTTSFYSSPSMMQHVRHLSQRPIFATLAYSSAMVPYAPPGIPMILDLIDVDSEKWLDFARVRRPGFLYALEGRRLRELEARFVRQARHTFVVTGQEQAVLSQFAPGCEVSCLQNGVDLNYFDPARCEALPELRSKKFVAFVGAMDYYPNADAVCRFASDVLPTLRAAMPELEFFIVGRDPSAAVLRTAKLPGVTVTGSVPDIRPYLSAAMAVVAPIRVARGIQNKVLEGLAMGKRTLISPEVARCFGGELPAGAVVCDSVSNYLDAIQGICRNGCAADPAIREDIRRRYSWETGMGDLHAQLKGIERALPAMALAERGSGL